MSEVGKQEVQAYLQSTGANALLERLVARLVREKPEDPRRTLAEWMAAEVGLNYPPKSNSDDQKVEDKDSKSSDKEQKTSDNEQKQSDNSGAKEDVLILEEATKVLADGTKIEADTDAAEQLSPAQLTALLQLNMRPELHLSNAIGACSDSVLGVSIAVNHAALNGWVKQPSPCCAASALAGAWNASLGFQRPRKYPSKPQVASNLESPDAYNGGSLFPLFHKDGLQAMGDILRAKVKELAKSVMYSLGCQRIDRPAPPQTRLEEEIHASIHPHDLDTFGAMAPLVAHTVALFPQYFQTHIQFPDGSRKKSKKVSKPMFYAAMQSAIESVLVARVEEGKISLESKEAEAPASSDIPEIVDLKSFTLPEWDCFSAYAEAFGISASSAVASAHGHASDPSIGGSSDSEVDAMPATDAAAAASAAPASQVSLSQQNTSDLEDEEDEDDDEAPDAGDAKPKMGKKGKASKKKKNSATRWKTLTGQMMHKYRGLRRASPHVERPSTAIYGNWGILQGARYLDRYFGGGVVSAEEIAGRAGPNKIAASKKRKHAIPYINSGKEKDAPSEKQLAFQWGQLWAHFTTPNTTLVYHLKNHYAIIFAMRQWTEIVDGITVYVREILTTRKGQRPKTWIPWTEVHATLRSWVGHKIMAIRGHKDYATTSHSVAKFAGEK